MNQKKFFCLSVAAFALTLQLGLSSPVLAMDEDVQGAHGAHGALVHRSYEQSEGRNETHALYSDGTTIITDTDTDTDTGEELLEVGPVMQVEPEIQPFQFEGGLRETAPTEATSAASVAEPSTKR